MPFPLTNQYSIYKFFRQTRILRFPGFAQEQSNEAQEHTESIESSPLLILIDGSGVVMGHAQGA